MHYINADGTLAQMCGNGVRCFAKYLVDRELADVASGIFWPTPWPACAPSPFPWMRGER